MTSGTCGQAGIGSSSSSALKRSLESKLQAMTAWRGPTLYKLTWKPRYTPAGLSIPALRASAPSTSGKGSTSQPCLKDLPQCRDGKILSGDLVGWSTASARDHKDTAGMALSGTNPDGSERSRTDQLPRQAQLTGWTTASATDGARGGTGITEGMSGCSLTQQIKVAGWPTPRRADGTSGPDYQTKARNAGGESLPTKAALSGWPTPMAGTPAQNGNNAAGNTDYSRKVVELCQTSGPIRLTATGETLTGSFAGMESGGQLNPAHSRWLMRLPDAWDACAPTETVSTLRKQQDSSAPFWKGTWQPPAPETCLSGGLEA